MRALLSLVNMIDFSWNLKNVRFLIYFHFHKKVDFFFCLHVSNAGKKNNSRVCTHELSKWFFFGIYINSSPKHQHTVFF